MAVEKRKVAPEVVSYTDDGHCELTIEISLPGLKKEDINLTLHDDSMFLNAPGEDVDYATTLSFCCPVIPGAARASYENGRLKLVVPFRDPLEDAVSVPID
ncbi:MAG: Hsp20/alpha crystallin family protein [Anaerolineae bacterium]